ncbi:MAG: SHOCT domain-containing protein [Bacteroidaceae bacterium]|nr:SHOCT domain-containing protein [Bacteroidaceae bacterium]
MTGYDEIKPTDILGGFFYKEELQNAQRIADYISVIIDEVDRQQSMNSHPIQLGNNSVADELAKLADLRAKGILTEEEFSAQKAKLLS